MEEYYEEEQWHENPNKVILLLIFFFPLGLYYMWKNEMWSPAARWIITAVLIFGVFSEVLSDDSGSSYSSSKVEVSAYEANAYAEELAYSLGHTIQDSYEYTYDGGFKLYIYLSGNTMTNSACFFVIRGMKLELFSQECGSYNDKQYAYSSFINNLNL